jgi:hypothetical protein
LSPLNVDGANSAEYCHNNTQSYGRLRGRYAHDEQGVYLTDYGVRCEKSIESHKIDASGIEHEFDGYKHTNERAALEHAKNPEAEKQGSYK